MKKYVKYIGYDSSKGSYSTEGLTINQYYEYIAEGEFVTVINDYGEEKSYCIELFA